MTDDDFAISPAWQTPNGDDRFVGNKTVLTSSRATNDCRGCPISIPSDVDTASRVSARITCVPEVAVENRLGSLVAGRSTDHGGTITSVAHFPSHTQCRSNPRTANPLASKGRSLAPFGDWHGRQCRLGCGVGLPLFLSQHAWRHLAMPAGPAPNSRPLAHVLGEARGRAPLRA